MKIHVDMALCQSHGQCVFAASDIFSFDDDETLRYVPEPAPQRREAVERAARSCPVQAITVDSGPR